MCARTASRSKVSNSRDKWSPTLNGATAIADLNRCAVRLPPSIRPPAHSDAGAKADTPSSGTDRSRPHSDVPGGGAHAEERRRAFLHHYGRLLELVVSLTLPDHGFDHNFHPGLLAAVRPRPYIAAADAYSTWKHPGAQSVQAVSSLPATLQMVTSKTASRAWELVSPDRA